MIETLSKLSRTPIAIGTGIRYVIGLVNGVSNASCLVPLENAGEGHVGRHEIFLIRRLYDLAEEVCLAVYLEIDSKGNPLFLVHLLKCLKPSCAEAWK